jgi:WD40 repeat protein
MDQGPLGFLEPDRALLAAAVSVLKTYGVDHGELEAILSRSLRLSDDVQRSSSEPSGLKFEVKSESLDELEYFYSGSRPAAAHLKKLFRNENEKQARARVKEYINNYLEERISKSFGNPRKFLDLRNPLKRIAISGDVSEVREPYFDCWSRLHTIHSHTQIEPTPDLACLVYHLIFDQTSNHILSASGDGLIKIYDRGLKLLKTARAHKRDISILTVSSDNKFMISADEGGLIRVFEFPSAKPVAVFVDQVGHEITTLHYLTENKTSPEGKEYPWRSFLMTTSPTAGFYIYEERHFINNSGIKKENQEFINLSSRIRDENGPLGFIASEANPKTGIIAAYSVKGNIYIWPRLSDMFSQEARIIPSPLKIIPGFHLPVEVALNATQQQIILQWSPNGQNLLCANETVARILCYDAEDHSFTQRAELVSDLQSPPYRRRGLNKSSFGSLNDVYVVVSFNLTSNSANEQYTSTCLLIYDLKTQSLVHKLNHGQTKVNMMTNTLAVSQHPIMEQICATTNTQGHIIIWDCTKGIALKMFVEHAGHAGFPLELNTASDCNFSRCGNYLAVGTSYGSFSLYGYGGGDIYQHVDIEQFTNMDFTPVDIFEETQEIICRGTGLTINSPEELAQTFFCTLSMQPLSRINTEMDYRSARSWIDDKAAQLRPRFIEMKKHDDNRNSEVVQVVVTERKRGAEFRKKYREALIQLAEGDLWSLKETTPINVISTPESVPVQTIQVAAVPHAPVVSQSSQIINEFQVDQREENSDEEFIRRRRLRRGRLVSESSVHEDDLDEEDEEIEDDEPELTESEDIDDGPAIRTRRRALFAQMRARGRLQRRTSDRLRNRNSQRANYRSTGMNLRSSRAQEEAALGKRDLAVQSQQSDEDSEEFYKNFGKNRQNKSSERKNELLAVVEEEHFCTRCQKVGARENCEGSGDGEGYGCHRIYHRDCSDLCGADIKNNTSFNCFYCLLKYYAANHRELYEMARDD